MKGWGRHCREKRREGKRKLWEYCGRVREEVLWEKPTKSMYWCGKGRREGTVGGERHGVCCGRVRREAPSAAE